MKVVSERSAEEIEAERKARAREIASDDFRWALVDLAVNVIRVTRGAGKAYEVGRQANKLIETMQAHWDAFGHYPAEADFHEALRHTADRDPEYGLEQWRRDAFAQIIRGSLQVTASRLAGQPTQVAAGEDEMWRGLRYYEEWREEQRRENAERDRAARAAAKSAKSKPVRRAKPK